MEDPAIERSGEVNYIFAGIEKHFLFSLSRMLVDNEAKWLAALKSDLNKPYQESCLSEIDFLKNEVISLRRNIRAWAKDQ